MAPKDNVGCLTTFKFVLVLTSQSVLMQVTCRMGNKPFCGTAMIFHSKIGHMTKMLLAYICPTRPLAWTTTTIGSQMGNQFTRGTAVATVTKNGASGMSTPMVPAKTHSLSSIKQWHAAQVALRKCTQFLMPVICAAPASVTVHHLASFDVHVSTWALWVLIFFVPALSRPLQPVTHMLYQHGRCGS